MTKNDPSMPNTNTNRIYIARLTNCPGALPNVKTQDGIDKLLKDHTVEF